MFQETQHVKRKKRAERTAQGVFLGMTLCMVLPLIAVVGFLICKASPVLSIDFIMDAPERMRAGGIWPAFWGTVCLVFLLGNNCCTCGAYWQLSIFMNTPLKTGSPHGESRGIQFGWCAQHRACFIRARVFVLFAGLGVHPRSPRLR